MNKGEKYVEKFQQDCILGLKSFQSYFVFRGKELI
jgi:hypothetical protein